jgi:hypothetical protein
VQSGRNWYVAVEARHCVVMAVVGLVVVMHVVANLVATDRFQIIVGPAVHHLCWALGYNALLTDGAAFAPVASPAGLHKRVPVLGKDKARKAPVVAPAGRETVAVVASTEPSAAARVIFPVLGM